MTGKIYLTGVRAYGYVGLLPEENVLGQWFTVDVAIATDFEAATYSDAIDDTLDYRSCIAKIETTIRTAKFALIERLAGAIADSLLEDPKIEKLELRVTKHPPIPNFQGAVAVEISRDRTARNRSIQDSIQLSERSQPQQLQLQAQAIMQSPQPSQSDGVVVKQNNQRSAIVTSIHTDGACSKNPGPGGWGVVVHFDNGDVQELGGGARNTTNNQMEMQGAIAALEFLAEQKQAAPVDLYTDSKYVIDGITKWIKGWKKNGWQTKDKKPVKNQELWQELDRLNSANVSWHWVEGHSGDPDNERCDAIARANTAEQVYR
ncbi:ribonuclease HI [Pseudanabaena sp. PCC 6802]|uniref:ribonuclease HI n=1 Tax=Pseudanabaena sp. PCC 6802 TaxID=118173 RepID=UPI0003457536|nr:ribonuclease HI [Pseudanabaena sp. PCC 6802]